MIFRLIPLEPKEKIILGKENKSLMAFLLVSAASILGMIMGALLGTLVASILNLWSNDLAERGMRRKVCGFIGVFVGGGAGALLGLLFRAL